MDVREKLVELIESARYWGSNTSEEIADHLISNGVTVQEWISVEDRLPKDSGYYLVVYQDKYNGSISIAFDMYVKCKAGEWWENDFMRDVTHWMPLPQPPKGETNNA